MSVELKIKAKHLALEPAIIRKEEVKLMKQINWAKRKYSVNDIYGDTLWPMYKKYFSLSNHRKVDVRNEARATQLARAYLAGRPYKSVEHKVHDVTVLKVYIVPRIVSMVAKYSENPIRQVWDRDKNRMTYEKEAMKALTETIEKWLELE